MSKIFHGFIMVFLCLQVVAAEVTLLPVKINIRDMASVQRGAKLFMNYCSGCHSLRYMRYNRMANDLGLTTFTGDIDKELLINNLIFTSAKIEDPIQISMPASDAREWFGRVPPDLSLSARQYSPAWLYTYLKSFYADTTRPFGCNNVLLPGVGMPNVLAPLAGKVIAISPKDGSKGTLLNQLRLVEPGEMNAQQFDSALQDLVAFLTYVAEPAKLTRYKMGWFVICFLLVFLIIAYQLKKAYWRDIK
jgi:ubiquinol-cytochrome c reductase cytochrome c1 subunit